MVEAFLRQAQQDADDVAGRRVFLGPALSQGYPGDGNRRTTQGCCADAGNPGGRFLFPARQAARGRPDGARSLPDAGQEAGRIEAGLGLLSGSRHHSQRAGVPAARPGVPAEQEMTVRYIAAGMERSTMRGPWISPRATRWASYAVAATIMTDTISAEGTASAR